MSSSGVSTFDWLCYEVPCDINIFIYLENRSIEFELLKTLSIFHIQGLKRCHGTFGNIERV